MIEQIYEPPSDTRWFNRALQKICRGRSIELRLEWMPRLFVAKTIDSDGNQRNYAKYPLRSGEFSCDHLGNRFYRDLGDGKRICTGYQKAGGVVPVGVLLTDIALPHIEYVNPSYHLYVIERRLPDERAKAVHEQKRRLAMANLGFDLFGDFPREGIWDWVGNISSHCGVMQPSGVEMTCCEIAAQNEVICEGIYREPNQKDLDAVREMLTRWEAIPTSDTDSLIDQAIRDRTQGLLAEKDASLRERLQEARESEQIDLIAHARTRVVLGTNAPLHRTTY